MDGAVTRLGGLARIDISPADVGRRVTIRRRIADRLADVVGIVESWSDGQLRVVRRSGEQVVVDDDSIVAARVVAPEQSAFAVQRALEAADPPGEVSRLGDWSLRWSETTGLGSVRVAGDPGMPVEQALGRAEEWYAERAAPAVLQVPRPHLLDVQLGSRGWSATRMGVVWQFADGFVETADDAEPPEGGVRHHGVAYLQRR